MGSKIEAGCLKMHVGTPPPPPSVVSYLGHRVTRACKLSNPALLKVIWSIPTLQNVREVRSFSGLASYYRRFVKGFAAIAALLHALTKKHVVFHWTPECQEAFVKLKHLLTTASIATFPDLNLPFRLYTVASTQGLGSILAQVQDRQERIIYCVLHAVSQTEKKLPSHQSILNP